MNTFNKGGKRLNIRYVSVKEIIAILSLLSTYFFIDIFSSDIISAVWSVIHSPDKLINAEIKASFIGEGIPVRETIIIPFDISKKPHSIAVHMSFLKGENAEISSHITEKNTIYTVIFINETEDSLTEEVKELNSFELYKFVFVTENGIFFLQLNAYKIAESM